LEFSSTGFSSYALLFLAQKKSDKAVDHLVGVGGAFFVLQDGYQAKKAQTMTGRIRLSDSYPFEIQIVINLLKKCVGKSLRAKWVVSFPFWGKRPSLASML
jgi:hypothetical protein